jgi:hypothetical protein
LFVQVAKKVAESKPDGCPVSDLVLGPKSKGARVRGRFGDVAVSHGCAAIFFSKAPLKGLTPTASSFFCSARLEK